ncbi:MULTISPECIES: PRC-barrel domain-containing protein [Paraburkholderia]|uniref:PRC-barrel domain-containing protein n=1 Tax=Paraburkholderia TaxID=1822464 RepID=UPI0006D42E67|nr:MULTISPECIES: PRC-barrel domain-containing protein [Paraburkholderia]ALP65898.1 photosystem reaction center subunit H [Paraburkholderia caribensis]AMV46147.1 photosystem reaction center subunit H [Paraburkholderia caribensis]AUT55173.1 photosystem reaction center subunit H [Paraburkholderia caribensis]MDR6382686.1 sporulation protein YlmC with PRC-barrel domain [Paraburkholderia caribensis]CAG9239208.1 Photosystem reaction center subunit H [Paraburkholderia caribensis]
MQHAFNRTCRIGVASLFIALVSTSALAQGAPQSVTERRTEVMQTGSGFRASKLAGTSVYNRDKDKIGTIDDLIVSPSDHTAFAILSVGGFLGMGKHYVAVPFRDLQITAKQVTMPEATKSSLEALPEFKYAPD